MTYKPVYIPRKHIRTADEKLQMDNLLTGIRKVRELTTGKPFLAQGEADQSNNAVKPTPN